MQYFPTKYDNEWVVDREYGDAVLMDINGYKVPIEDIKDILYPGKTYTTDTGMREDLKRAAEEEFLKLKLQLDFLKAENERLKAENTELKEKRERRRKSNNVQYGLRG